MSILTVIPTGAVMLVNSSPGGEGKISAIINRVSTPGKAAEKLLPKDWTPTMKREWRKAAYGHVELVSSGGVLGENHNSGMIRTVGASWPKVQERDLSKFVGCQVWFISPRVLDVYESHAQAMIAEAKERAAKEEKYSIPTLFAHLGDYGVNRGIELLTLGQIWPDWRPFSSMPFFKSGVCSWFVADLLRRYLGVVFDRKPRMVTPADIQRFVWEDLYDVTNPSMWKSLWRGRLMWTQ